MVEEFRDPLQGGPTPPTGGEGTPAEAGAGTTGPEREAGLEETQKAEDEDQGKDKAKPAEWHRLKSSNVIAYKYEKKDRQLSIVFAGNRLYRYENVPESVADGLQTADSPGKYVHRKIKRKFAFSHV